MGIPILKGREFTKQDTVAAPGVIVINEAMAHAFWPKEDPVSPEEFWASKLRSTPGWRRKDHNG
ncbi:MAG TPA: hypothetical protein VGZ73_15630 [Bryobacteraceae bacterium]|jgi:hypothetical protein|nr:hypothetical protein [Bryobacteraceae bacterium]